MPDDRTTVSELATALGMVGYSTLSEAVAQRPDVLKIDDKTSAETREETWERLDGILASGAHGDVARAAFANGAFFAAHTEGLGGRPPRLIEWSGGRRMPGDQAIPADLVVDRVFVVSCKYLSQILHNTAPARVFEELLRPPPVATHPDWFATVARRQHSRLYRATIEALGLQGMPAEPDELDANHKELLKTAFKESGISGVPPTLATEYKALIDRVSVKSATRWQAALKEPAQQRRMLWRLLRIYSATYFILGIDKERTMRLRVMTPWEWRETYRLVSFSVEAGGRGQPRVNWTARYRRGARDPVGELHGHMEIRWSHRPFCGPPEAKVYLDARHDEVPGYVRMDTPNPTPAHTQLQLPF